MNTEHKMLLSIGEAASSIGLANSTFRAMLAAGTIKSVKIGGRKLVHVDDLRSYVDGLRAAQAEAGVERV